MLIVVASVSVVVGNALKVSARCFPLPDAVTEFLSSVEGKRSGEEFMNKLYDLFSAVKTTHNGIWDNIKGRYRPNLPQDPICGQ